jgi:hypothetical protein
MAAPLASVTVPKISVEVVCAGRGWTKRKITAHRMGSILRSDVIGLADAEKFFETAGRNLPIFVVKKGFTFIGPFPLQMRE